MESVWILPFKIVQICGLTGRVWILPCRRTKRAPFHLYEFVDCKGRESCRIVEGSTNKIWKGIGEILDLADDLCEFVDCKGREFCRIVEGSLWEVWKGNLDDPFQDGQIWASCKVTGARLDSPLQEDQTCPISLMFQVGQEG